MLARRTFLKDLGRGVIFVATYPVLTGDLLEAGSLRPTPSNTEGPYFVPGAPLRRDLREPGDSGTPLSVQGLLVDTSDTPIVNGLIEVWQTDNSGRYDLDGFRYRAGMKTSKNGGYHFETFMPGNYGGRPRHIHYKITAPGYETLVTQLYFENDPFFEGRPEQNLRKDSLVQHRELIRPVIPFQQGKAVSVNFKICLAADNRASAKNFLGAIGQF